MRGSVSPPTGRHEDEVLGRAFDFRLTRRLLRFLAPYKVLFAGCVALTIGLAGIQLSIPYLSKVAIDSFMTPPWAIVVGVESPGGAAAVAYGSDALLVDTRTVDAEILNGWETGGNLAAERYVWVAPGDDRVGALADYPDVGVAIDGGILLSADDLRALPASVVSALRQVDISGVLRLVGLFLFLLLTRFAFGVLQVYYLQLTGQRVMYDMRREIFAHILRLPLSFFDRTPVGRLVTRVTNDVAAINEMFTSTLVSLFRDVFLVAGVMVVMFQLEWRLALAILILFPVIVVAAWQFRNRVRSAYRDVRKKIAQLNAYLQESISGMRIVQVFVQEHYANRQFLGINSAKYDA
ncbi:ABC transporter ATP-binding protein, partial [Candidatus Bipolaricaulota bacterium]|nr:ABC transporter ATP-binding protein [Candidatus Bipolaricaulota bacterium]